VSLLAERIVLLHQAWRRAGIPHAFGGALALAFCTERPRGTIDIDVNVFTETSDAKRVLAALPRGARHNASTLTTLTRDGQVRVLWEHIPVDIFLSTTGFHRLAAARTVWHRFGDANLPFLACRDLAVFKAFFARTKDWADLEEMHRVGLLDVQAVSTVISEYLGPDDERIARLRQIANG
jgi:hypothetical protein